MAEKVFEVGDVLPQGLVEIYGTYNWSGEINIFLNHILFIQKFEDDNELIFGDSFVSCLIKDETSFSGSGSIYAVFDFSSLSESQRTVDYCFNDSGTVYWGNYIPGYSVTYEENGGTEQTDLSDVFALPNPLPTPTKENHTFLGWFYDSDFTNEAFAGDPLTDDVTLYAKWGLTSGPSGFTITFETNGGTTISDIEDATELPNPLPPTTKSGYTFGGWYYESNFQTRAKAGDTIEANTTLYAKWLTLAQVLEHINNVVEELRSAIIDKGGDAEGKLLIDFATIINSLKTYEVVETLAELELLEPTLNRIVFVVEGSGEPAMGEPVKVTQDGDTLIIG